MSSQVVFDLDGTIADNRHRKHLIEGENKQWSKYLKKCKEDSLVEKTFDKMKKFSDNYEVVILTCRSDKVREETVDWLEKHGVPFDSLIMLPEGRWSIRDCEFKREKLTELNNPVIAFDDKESNCKMFFEEELKIFHVDGLPEPVFERFSLS